VKPDRLQKYKGRQGVPGPFWGHVDVTESAQFLDLLVVMPTGNHPWSGGVAFLASDRR
jgi:hypothetical protein